MLARFQQHWHLHFNGFQKPDQPFLLAMSGGADSTVLAVLLKSIGVAFYVAHVNYQLRGEESNRDEAFVSSFCSEHAIPCRIKRVDTIQYKNETGLSTQVAARKIRYDWFDQLRKDHAELADSWIITAHHANDAIETSTMHFFRGTGLEGLKGIVAVHKEKRIIRPLLPFLKEEIEAFAIRHSIAFVKDSSNDKNDYTRNYFRNQLIPSVKNVFPGVEQNLLANLTRFTEATELYKQAVIGHLKKLLHWKGKECHVPVMLWQKANPLHTITWEIISPFEFTANQIPEVIKLLTAANSSYIQSATHRIIRNRSWMIIAPLASEEAVNIVIDKPGVIHFSEGKLELSLRNKSDASLSSANSGRDAEASIELLDARAVKFPLLLRKWKTGDYFYPLGMGKKKKIAKFLMDLKLSKTEKEKIWILESENKIMVVLGKRIDHRFRCLEGTTQQLAITFTAGSNPT